MKDMWEKNYPPIIDRALLNRPPAISWGGDIANIPSAVGGIVDRTVHAQLGSRLRLLGQNLPPRGTGLITGTARPRMGLAKPLSNVERAARHKSIFGQRSVLGRFLGTGSRPARNIASPYMRGRLGGRTIVGNFPSAASINNATGTVLGERSPIQIADTHYPDRGDRLQMSVVHT